MKDKGIPICFGKGLIGFEVLFKQWKGVKLGVKTPFSNYNTIIFLMEEHVLLLKNSCYSTLYLLD